MAGGHSITAHSISTSQISQPDPFPARIAVMAYFLGIDVGSVNAKLSLVEEDGKVIHLDVRKITTNARTAVNSLIGTLGQQFNLLSSP